MLNFVYQKSFPLKSGSAVVYLVRMLLIACPWDRGSWCSMPVRYSKIWQMGPQAYGTTLPAFHTMHCSYLNYHRYGTSYFFQEPKNVNLYNLDFLFASKQNLKKVYNLYIFWSKTKLVLRGGILYLSNSGSWEKATLANLSRT